MLARCTLAALGTGIRFSDPVSDHMLVQLALGCFKHSAVRGCVWLECVSRSWMGKGDGSPPDADQELAGARIPVWEEMMATRPSALSEGASLGVGSACRYLFSLHISLRHSRSRAIKLSLLLVGFDMRHR